LKGNIIKIPELKNSKWTDKDIVLFFSCFCILGQFVENELGLEDNPKKAYRGYRVHFIGKRQRRLIDLWLWFKSIDKEKIHFLDNELYAECNKKLKQLITYRNSMWT